MGQVLHRRREKSATSIYAAKQMSADGKVVKEGEWITLDGNEGVVYDRRSSAHNPGNAQELRRR
jgi:hypothetical protein